MAKHLKCIASFSAHMSFMAPKKPDRKKPRYKSNGNPFIPIYVRLPVIWWKTPSKYLLHLYNTRRYSISFFFLIPSKLYSVSFQHLTTCYMYTCKNILNSKFSRLNKNKCTYRKANFRASQAAMFDRTSRNGDGFVGNPRWFISPCLMVESYLRHCPQDWSLGCPMVEIPVKSEGKPRGACSDAAVTQTDDSVRVVLLLLVLMRLDQVVERFHTRPG